MLIQPNIKFVGHTHNKVMEIGRELVKKGVSGRWKIIKKGN